MGLAAVLGPWSLYLISLKMNQKKLQVKKEEEEVKVEQKTTETTEIAIPTDKRRILILYGTCTGTAKNMAEEFSKKIHSLLYMDEVDVKVVDAKDYDEFLLDQEDIVLFIISTWTDGEPPENAKRVVDSLKDYASDFRVSKSHLAKNKFAVFGLGGSDYSSNFCKAAKDINDCFLELGATPLLPLHVGDDSGDLLDKFHKWSDKVVKKLKITFAGITLQPVNNKYYENSFKPKNEIEHKSEPTPNPASDKINNKDDIKIKSNKMKSNAIKPKTGKSKANDFNLQQKLVREEAKGIKSGNTEKKEPEKGGCCGGSSSGEKKESCGSNDAKKAEESACCGGSKGTMDGNNKLGLEEEEEEEEEDRINQKYVNLNNDNTSEDGFDDNGNEIEGDEEEEEEETPDGDLLDLEDIGSAMKKQVLIEKQNKAIADSEADRNGDREMVTKLQRRALTKEGYRIIGTHSAVKLCRWTKNQMRGRGGCYKHTFYGITSYQCMEATPSLACANKCVFCWRHHKNPVGTEWRWKTDDPDFIVAEAVDLHRTMINEMRGVPGVQPERLVEADTVKHCALSLVGEPIMYPRINEMLKALHERKISTFLVTNAQFPESIRDLEPITQLYVSIDASTRDSLKAIDRPLFKDFWERFLESLKYMEEKKQRTVYRLTLVKSWNMEEADSYVELIETGQPDFIEIKSVTYCGKSDASSLTMQNVPWHQETCSFSEAIANRLAERGISARYSIATEHEHSCCVLLAREDKFKPNGVWHTWIDYAKYHTLIQDYYASGGEKKFISEDYMAITPEWALYKSKEHGFDPEESRWKRNKAGALVLNEYKSSDSGCG